MLDNLSTGSIQNIEHLKAHPGVPLRRSTASPTSRLLAELIDDCDVVFHLAAAVGVKLIVEAPVHTIETNVHGTEVVLKHANKKKKLVVIASTSEVYGKSTDVPFREDADLVIGPDDRSTAGRTPAARRSTSSSRWRTGRRRKLPVIIVRFFNTVGPRQTGRYGMVIPNFVRQGLAGQPITVHGDGTQTRSFCHVRRRRRRAAARSWTSRGRSARSSTSATARRSRSWRWPSECATLTGGRSPIVTIPYDQAYEAGFEDMPRRVPDLSKIHALVGYEPRSGPRRDPGRRDRRFPEAVDVLQPLRRQRTQGHRGASSRRNARLVKRVLLATGRDEAPLPEIVQIESTNICNAKCVFCPRDEMERKQGDHGHGAVHEDRGRVRRARHRARADAQLRRALRGSRSSSRRCATPSRRASRRSA